MTPSTTFRTEPDNTLREDAAVITLVGVCHATSHLFHLLLPPLFPLLMPEFGLGFTEAGFLLTIFFAISGVGQAFAGIVVDRYGARRVLMAGIGLLSLSGFLLAVANSYPLLLAVVALAGVGNSVFHPADFSLLNKRVSPARLGYAFSVHGLSGNLGWAVGAIIAGTVMVWAGWRGAGVAAGVVSALVVALLYATRHRLDDAPAEAAVVAAADRQAESGVASAAGGVAPKVGAGATASASAAASAASSAASGAASASVLGATFGFLGVPAVWLAFLFFLLITAAFGGLQSFAAPVLGGLYGLTPGVAVAALTGYLMGSAAGMIAGGVIASRVHAHDRTVGTALGASALFAILLATGLPADWLVIPLMVGLGLGVGMAGPSRDLLVRRAATESVPGGRTSPAFGRVYGFVYSGLDVGMAAGPVAFGALLDAGGRNGVLPGIAVLQVLAVFTVLAMGRRVGDGTAAVAR